MTEISNNSINTKKFGKDSGINVKNDNMQAGGLKRESVSNKYLSIFDKLDSDKNQVLDSSEMQNFQAEVDKDNSSYIEKKEAKAFLYGDDGKKLTYQDEKGKTKDLSARDLNDFLKEYAQNIDSADVKNASKTVIDGKAAVEINKNDGTKEIIFNDKKEPTRTITQSEDGSVTTQFKKDGKTIKDEVKSSDGKVTTTTEYSQDDKPVLKTAADNSNGKKEVTNYEDGKPVSKDVELGTKKSHYSIDANGKEVLETEIENKGNDTLEKTSVHEYGENGQETVTITQAGKTTVQLKTDGKLKQETISEQGKNTVISYDETGGKNVTETSSNGRVTTTDYNEASHRTGQTVIGTDGKSYEARYDGEGNTYVQINAGENAAIMADRINKRRAPGQPKVTAQQIIELNSGVVSKDGEFKLQILKNGSKGLGEVKIPGEQEADSSFMKSRQSSETANSRASAAETALNNQLNNLSETYVQTGTKGKYKSYDEYAAKLLENEGITPNEQLVNKTAKKIKEMNGGKDISALDSIKCPVSPKYKQKLDASKSKAQEAKKDAQINKFRQEGRQVASDIHNAVTGLGTNIIQLHSGLSHVNKNNAAHAVLAYRDASNEKEGISSAITNEFGLSSDEKRKDLTIIYNNLEARAKELNIDTSKANKEFKTMMANGDFDGKKLDNLMETMATKIAQKEGLSASEIKHASTADRKVLQKETVEFLDKSYKTASTAYNNQVDYDGWAGKVADACGHVTTLYNGKDNYSGAVQKDLQVYRKQVMDLKKAQAQGQDAFEAKFKEIYGVDYDPAMVKAYNNQKEKWAKVDAAHTQKKLFENDNNNLLNYDGGKVSSGMFRTADDRIRSEMTVLAQEMQLDYTRTGSSPQAIQRDFIDNVAGPALKAKFGDKMKWSTATNEQKYAVLSDIAKRYDNVLEKDFKEKSGGQTYIECKTQTQNAYKAAFGVSNDIQARVEDYCHSQEVGASIVKTAVKTAVVAGVGIATGGTGTAAATMFVASAAVESSDVASSNSRKFDKETTTGIVKTATIDAALVFGGGETGKALKDVSTSAKIIGSVTSNTGLSIGAQIARGDEINADVLTKNAVYSAVGTYIGLKTGSTAGARIKGELANKVSNQAALNNIEKAVDVGAEISKKTFKKAVTGADDYDF